jgi:hypothetical protein
VDRILVWCDQCRTPHEADTGPGPLIHVLCPLEPPGQEFWLDPAYVKRMEGPA